MAKDIDVSAENYEYEVFEENEFIQDEEYDDESDMGYNALAVLGTYDGQRNSDNERHGFGKAILPNGDAYVGTYRNGERHGHGTYTFKNGGSYQGCYKRGLRNGKGVMRYPNNARYEGYWTDNKKDGEGVYRFENNDEFSGYWKSDMKHGAGTYTFCKTGTILKGTWSEDKKVNNFQIFFPTSEGRGFSFHGIWDDNESIAGEGYFVFENLNCMQKGVYVENPAYENTTLKQNAPSNSTKSIWFSNQILPIIRSMLPLPSKNQPTFDKKSSCEINLPPMQVSTSNIPISTSNVEMYEHGTSLWNEIAEEYENKSDAYIFKPEPKEGSSSLKSQELEEESKSINYQKQDVDP